MPANPLSKDTFEKSRTHIIRFDISPGAIPTATVLEYLTTDKHKDKTCNTDVTADHCIERSKKIEPECI